jgi:hypothetical protein
LEPFLGALPWSFLGPPSVFLMVPWGTVRVFGASWGLTLEVLCLGSSDIHPDSVHNRCKIDPEWRDDGRFVLGLWAGFVGCLQEEAIGNDTGIARPHQILSYLPDPARPLLDPTSPAIPHQTPPDPTTVASFSCGLFIKGQYMGERTAAAASRFHS